MSWININQPSHHGLTFNHGKHEQDSVQLVDLSYSETVRLPS